MEEEKFVPPRGTVYVYDDAIVFLPFPDDANDPADALLDDYVSEARNWREDDAVCWYRCC